MVHLKEFNKRCEIMEDEVKKEIENSNKVTDKEIMGDDREKEMENSNKEDKNYKNEIILGYLLSFLGGILGFIVGAHLITRDDKRARKHGLIILIIAILFLIVGFFFIGTAIGYTEGYSHGNSTGYFTGYNHGANIGYDNGFMDGWNHALYKGSGEVTNNGKKIKTNHFGYNPFIGSYMNLTGQDIVMG
ncbi:hypothetical protein MBCUT_07210 [Methanobrevibacter cuticularis]|uniref:Uncharacterized protein n=2 Tax=Methanobrevibacter cuticularis TaxID=47311 RepID=A0A166CSW9_9EURY|nr:hypothetical protein MBCUT_07210 [Methanobrevibacter cuticularis]